MGQAGPNLSETPNEMTASSLSGKKDPERILGLGERVPEDDTGKGGAAGRSSGRRRTLG